MSYNGRFRDDEDPSSVAAAAAAADAVAAGTLPWRVQSCLGFRGGLRGETCGGAKTEPPTAAAAVAAAQSAVAAAAASATGPTLVWVDLPASEASGWQSLTEVKSLESKHLRGNMTEVKSLVSQHLRG
jgi:hypothetical protein